MIVLLSVLFPVKLSVCLPLAGRDELLNPENDTIGILVSTAVEITVGGKTVKPAGALGSENIPHITIRICRLLFLLNYSLVWEPHLLIVPFICICL